jgi:hypothetical protein
MNPSTNNLMIVVGIGLVAFCLPDVLRSIVHDYGIDLGWQLLMAVGPC